MNLRYLTGALLLVISTSLIMSTSALAKKGGNPGGGGDGAETGHVSMIVTGAVLANQDCDEKLSADDSSYLCNKGAAYPLHHIELGEFFMSHNFDGVDPGECFGNGIFPVTIGVEQHRSNAAEAVLRFWAFKGDGVTEVLYVLRVNDPSGWFGDFPPAVGYTATMGEPGGSGISWDLGATNKKQEKGACVDSGTFTNNGSDFIQVDFNRVD